MCLTPSNRKARRVGAIASNIVGLTLLAGILDGRVVESRGQAPAAAAAYSLTSAAYGMELKTPDGRVVFQYMTKKPVDVNLTSPSVACFHPINTPTGERVSAFAPDDHPHHRGMYIAWHDGEFRRPINPPTTATGPLFGWNVTKADFWGWGQYAPRDGKVIETQSVKLVAGDASRAEIAIQNAWMSGRNKMLDETTQTTVTERDGTFVIDSVFKIAPVVDYVLNKNAFGGFNFQARKDGESYYTNAAGTVTYRDPHYSVPELNWPAAEWYGYVIRLTNGKTVGAVVIDHPMNPPSTWHNSRSLWMLNPSISALQAITIRPSAPLTLRYRVVVHDGTTPTATIQKLAAEFRAAK
jgi:hypothetical protein